MEEREEKGKGREREQRLTHLILHSGGAPGALTSDDFLGFGTTLNLSSGYLLRRVSAAAVSQGGGTWNRTSEGRKRREKERVSPRFIYQSTSLRNSQQKRKIKPNSPVQKLTNSKPKAKPTPSHQPPNSTTCDTWMVSPP